MSVQKRKLPGLPSGPPPTDTQPVWKWALLGAMFFYAILGTALIGAFVVISKFVPAEHAAPYQVVASVLALPSTAWATAKLLRGPAMANGVATRWAGVLSAASLALLSLFTWEQGAYGVGAATAMVLALLVQLGNWLGNRAH